MAGIAVVESKCMAHDIAIQLRGISKVFEIYSRPSDRLKQMLWGRRRQFYREFWAVRNIDLEIYRGETVGIVGCNGAGKSTLLQMICGTLKPTTGAMEVKGRIAALLELGSGFNPEFTGRENVFINAAILGLSRQEIEQRFDTIAAFANIGDFIEQPVKVYSSGMYARLAFAVAINVDPGILVVDEALAVGDEAFQRKCYARLHQIRDNGGTVLFVSHSAGLTVELCDRAVLLDHGERLLTGKPKTVINRYQRLIYAPREKVEAIRQEVRLLDQGIVAESSGSTQDELKFSKLAEQVEQVEQDDEDFDPNLKSVSAVHYSPKGAEIYDVKILNEAGNQINVLKPGKRYFYSYKVKITKPATRVRFGMMIKTKSGVHIGGMTSHELPENGLDYVNEGDAFHIRFSFETLLNPGLYFLNAGVSGWLTDHREYLHRALDTAVFRIEPILNQRATGYVDFSGGQGCMIRKQRAFEETSMDWSQKIAAN